jgi:serine phosphatase RsbU (regulator of sigma subunit)
VSRGGASAAAARRFGQVRLAAIPLLVALAALIALDPRWNARLQSLWFDAYQTLWPRQIVSMPATIVEIDHKSLAALGQWPWPRSVLAQLIDDIARHRPAAIGIDIVMPEADARTAERVLARAGKLDPAIARQLAALPSSDTMLARSLAAAPTVLAITGSAERTGMPLRAPPFGVLDSVAAPIGAPAPAPRVMRYAGVLTSIDELDRAAVGRGLISVVPEGGIIRRIPLAASVDGTLVPTLAIEMIRVALGAPPLRLRVAADAVEGVEAGAFFAATEADGAGRVYFSPSSTDRYVSAIDILDGRFDPEQLREKLVLIGVTGVGMIEDKNTPLGVPMPGVEIHAQLLENLFDQTLLTRPAWAPRVEALAFLLLGSVLVVATPRWKPHHAALLALGGIALLLASGILVFRTQRLLFDAATPAMGLGLLFATLLVLTLAEANRQKKSLERIVQRQREESARIAGELDAARRIQTATLPRPDLLRDDPRIDLAATMIPAREVGGDLYDFFRLDDRRLFFLVGDVAGKGLPASIFMAVSKALYKSTMLRATGADIGELMSVANAEVSRDNQEMLFVTAFAGILDLETGDLAYCNAGHENPYLLHPGDGTVRRIEDGGGPPLCAVDDYAYPEARYRMRPGERLCVVSDGVTEARRASGDLYGGERVRATLLRLTQSALDARALVDAVRADVESFAAGAEAVDDLTVLVLCWNGPRATGSAASD